MFGLILFVLEVALIVAAAVLLIIFCVQLLANQRQTNALLASLVQTLREPKQTPDPPRD